MLSRAKALFSKKASSTPSAEPFALRCTCGRKIEGIRRADAQTLICEHCSAAVFVLPINVLPMPGPAKKSKAGRAARLASFNSNVEPVPDADLDVSIPAPNESGAAARKRPAILDRKWQIEEADEEQVARRARPLVTRNQWIVLCVVTFVTIAGVGVYRRMVVKDLVENLPDRALRGLQLVQEGKLDEAYEPLRLAWKAIDWAGGRHLQSETIYQVFQEVSAVRDLFAEPLDAALEAEAGNLASLTSRYAGKAILLDMEVEKDPEGGWLFHWALPVGEKVAHLHPKGLKLLDDLEISQAKRLLLAARIEGVELVDGDVLIRLQPNSGVLVTEFAVLEKMGLGGDATADAARRAQRRRVLPQ